MRAEKTEKLLWSKEELLQKKRQAPEEHVRFWALQWLFRLFGKEKDVQPVFQEELNLLKEDADLSRFSHVETIFPLLGERENADVNGPFLLEKARQFFRQYFQEGKETRELFFWNLWALSLCGYQPGLAFLQEILGDLCRAYRKAASEASSGAKEPGGGGGAEEEGGLEMEAKAEAKGEPEPEPEIEPEAEAESKAKAEAGAELLRYIDGILSVAALYALREPEAYRKIFTPLLSQAEDDDVLWLHLAGGAIKGGDYTLVEPFARRYLSIPPEQRKAHGLYLFFGDLLGVGPQLKLLYNRREDENSVPDGHSGLNISSVKDFRRHVKGKGDRLYDAFVRLRRLLNLLKLYPELRELFDKDRGGEEEGERAQYYEHMYDLTLRRLEKEGLPPGSFPSEALWERLQYGRLLFLKAFSEHAAAAQTKKEKDLQAAEAAAEEEAEEEAGRKAALQELWRMEKMEKAVMLLNAVFLLKFSFLFKKRPNFFRRHFWEGALDFFHFTPPLVEREAFEEELFASLDARDIAFLARTAGVSLLTQYLDDAGRLSARVNLNLKGQRGAGGRKRKEKSAINYIRKKALLEPFPERESLLPGLSKRLDALTTKLEVFERGQNCIALLEEYASKAPEKLLPHLPLLVELFYHGIFSYPIISIIDEMGAKAFVRLKQLCASSRGEKKRALLYLFFLFPFVRARELFLQNWEDFYSCAPEEVLEVVEKLADPAFLPFLLQEWKAGSREAAGLIMHIRDLHNPDNLPPELPQIQRYLLWELRLEKEIAAIVDSDRPAEEKMLRIQRLKPYVELTLRCSICGKLQRQRFESLNIVKEFYDTVKGDLAALQRTAFPSEFVTCIRCGAVNKYTYTPETEREIVEELELFEEIASPRKAEREDAEKQQEYDYDDSNYPRLRFIALDWKDEEARSLSPLEALDYFSRKIEENPQMAEYYVGLAEVFSFFKRYEEADRYFARARRLAPEDPAAYFAEGLSNLERGDYKGARRLFRQFLRLVEGPKEGQGQKVDAAVAEKQKERSEKEQEEQEELKEKIALARQVLEVTPGLGKEEGTVVTLVSNQPKVGRNDPCPCGSGKKYKKCCGR